LATPTFTSVTPAVGNPAGGQEVEIVGTNFRTTPVQYTVQQAESFPSVQVTVAGIPAEFVHVVSSTLLRVGIPTARFNPNVPALADAEVSRVTFPAVDIVITNVDIDGNPIAGETATEVGAYTYEQPLLRLPEGDPPMLQVFRQFLYLLKRTVVSRVAKSTHTDYGDAGGDVTKLAEHPSVGVKLAWPRDVEYAYFDNEKQVLPIGGGLYQEYDIQQTVMMVASLTLSTKSETELFHMTQAVLDLCLASPWLNVPPDPDFPGDFSALQTARNIPATGINRYPMEVTGWPEQIGSLGRTNVKANTAQIRVRGIPFLRGDPAQIIHQITTIELTDTNMQGQNPVTVTV